MKKGTLYQNLLEKKVGRIKKAMWAILICLIALKDATQPTNVA